MVRFNSSKVDRSLRGSLFKDGKVAPVAIALLTLLGIGIGLNAITISYSLLRRSGGGGAGGGGGTDGRQAGAEDVAGVSAALNRQNAYARRAGLHDCTCVNGDCVERINGYTCNCHAGFGGDNCDLDLKDCTCVNGDCVERINGYTCNCHAGFGGDNCDLDLKDIDDDGDDDDGDDEEEGDDEDEEGNESVSDPEDGKLGDNAAAADDYAKDIAAAPKTAVVPKDDTKHVASSIAARADDGHSAGRPYDENTPCAYQKLDDLTPAERFPKEGGGRHIATPHSDEWGALTLICCRTTAGPLSVAVHTNWAPRGAWRFLEMVESGYFSTRVPLFRCIKNWICQFGIAGDPDVDKKYKNDLMLDDEQWLPGGPTHREHDGVKRFAKGYLAYAGGGPNTRTNQFIVALEASGPLGGGSPWEVPWGEVVGPDSFDTLGRIYTGYGEDGPSQGMLHQHGSSREVKDKFPKMDYITSCDNLDEVIAPRPDIPRTYQTEEQLRALGKKVA